MKKTFLAQKYLFSFNVLTKNMLYVIKRSMTRPGVSH